MVSEHSRAKIMVPQLAGNEVVTVPPGGIWEWGWQLNDRPENNGLVLLAKAEAPFDPDALRAELIKRVSTGRRQRRRRGAGRHGGDQLHRRQGAGSGQVHHSNRREVSPMQSVSVSAVARRADRPRGALRVALALATATAIVTGMARLAVGRLPLDRPARDPDRGGGRHRDAGLRHRVRRPGPELQGVLRLHRRLARPRLAARQPGRPAAAASRTPAGSSRSSRPTARSPISWRPTRIRPHTIYLVAADTGGARAGADRGADRARPADGGQRADAAAAAADPRRHRLVGALAAAQPARLRDRGRRAAPPPPAPPPRASARSPQTSRSAPIRWRCTEPVQEVAGGVVRVQATRSRRIASSAWS